MVNQQWAMFYHEEVSFPRKIPAPIIFPTKRSYDSFTGMNLLINGDYNYSDGNFDIKQCWLLDDAQQYPSKYIGPSTVFVFAIGY